MRRGDQAISEFAQGIEAVAALVRPVYGPGGGLVAHAGATGRSAPELLTDGATIARRLTEVGNRSENTGAMFLRGLLWDVQERVGDGSSTAAILFDALYREGRRGIQAGLNAARLRHFLLAYAKLLRLELERQRLTVADGAALRRLARSVARDESMANAIAEIYAGLGIHCHIEVRLGRGNHIDYDYLDDAFWPSKSLDDALVRGLIGQRVELPRCALFLSDIAFENRAQLMPVLAAAKARQARSLLIIGRGICKQSLGLLLANACPSFPIHAMRTPETAPLDQLAALDDIATISGATVFQEAAGADPRLARAGELGFVRRAWVSRTHFGLFGGQGESRALRTRIRQLRADFLGAQDERSKAQISLRISRLTARSAIVWVDGTTERASERRKLVAERTCRVVRDALIDGALPGGGAALLACSRHMGSVQASSDELEETFALQMLTKGLEAPIRVLAHNSGMSSGIVINHAFDTGHGGQFDVNSGHLVDAASDGVLDGFEVVATAVQHAVSGVSQALTIDSIILPRRPSIAAHP